MGKCDSSDAVTLFRPAKPRAAIRSAPSARICKRARQAGAGHRHRTHVARGEIVRDTTRGVQHDSAALMHVVQYLHQRVGIRHIRGADARAMKPLSRPHSPNSGDAHQVLGDARLKVIAAARSSDDPAQAA
jgi:hypothetical protein